MTMSPLSGPLVVADATGGGIPPGAGVGRELGEEAGGRRRGAAEGQRDRVVKARFTEAELVLVRGVAVGCGWSVRGWLGQVGMAAGGVWRPVSPPALHRPLIRVVREATWQVRRVDVLVSSAARWTGDAPQVTGLLRRCAGTAGWSRLVLRRLQEADLEVVQVAAFQAAMVGGRDGRRPRGSDPLELVGVRLSAREWAEIEGSAAGAGMSVAGWVAAVGVAVAGAAATSMSMDAAGLVTAGSRVRATGQAVNASVAQMHRGGDVPPRFWKEIEMADKQVSAVTAELEKLLDQRETGQGRRPLIDMTQPPLLGDEDEVTDEP